MQFLGIIEGKGLYASWNEKHKQIRYNLDGQEIAIYDLNFMRLEDPIVFKNNTIQNELSAEARDKIQILAREIDVQNLQEQELNSEDEKDIFSVALDIDKKDMISYTEVDLEENLDETETTNKNEIVEEETMATIKDITIKQELSMNSMATSMKTIGQILKNAGKIPNIEGKEFVKLGIIESDKIKDIDKNAKTNTTRFSFIAIAKDGTIVPLYLEQDHAEGNNPREINYRTKADGRVEQDDVTSRYIIGNKDETISVKHPNGPGNIEVGYSAHKTLGGEVIEGNESLDHELETKTVYYRPRIDSRDQEYSDGIRGTEEKVREAYIESKHEKELEKGKKGTVDDDTHKYKDIDGDEKTKDSHHENDLIERVRKLKNENPEVGEAFTDNELLERMENEHNKGKAIEDIEEEIKTDAYLIKRHTR